MWLRKASCSVMIVAGVIVFIIGPVIGTVEYFLINPYNPITKLMFLNNGLVAHRPVYTARS